MCIGVYIISVYIDKTVFISAVIRPVQSLSSYKFVLKPMRCSEAFFTAFEMVLRLACFSGLYNYSPCTKVVRHVLLVISVLFTLDLKPMRCSEAFS